MLRVRRQYPILRIGRQYGRPLRLPSAPGGFHFPQHGGEALAWSRILDSQEALVVVNANGERGRSGDVMVARELWAEGVPFEVVLNTAQVAAEAQGGAYGGTHPHGAQLRTEQDPATGTVFVGVRDLGPAETLVLIKQF
jgi:hypothetical protein